MRLALLGDIHGNLPALLAVDEDLRRRGGADVVAVLGDLLSGPLLARDTAAWLMARRSDWLFIAGNHEWQLLDAAHPQRSDSDACADADLASGGSGKGGPGGEAIRDGLRALPSTLRLADGQGGEILLCHGTPHSDSAYFLDSAAQGRTRAASLDEIDERLGGEAAGFIACGHTHSPRCLRSRAGQVLVNPGSVGLQAYVHDDPEPHGVENGTPDARYAIAERSSVAGWAVAQIAVPYEHEPMARLAETRGRPDWAMALRQGRMG